MTSPTSHQIFFGDRVLDRLHGRNGALGPLLAKLLMTAATWRHRHRTRRQLAELGPYALRDIGLTPDQARREARKPFWRV